MKFLHTCILAATFFGFTNSGYSTGLSITSECKSPLDYPEYPLILIRVDSFSAPRGPISYDKYVTIGDKVYREGKGGTYNGLEFVLENVITPSGAMMSEAFFISVKNSDYDFEEGLYICKTVM